MRAMHARHQIEERTVRMSVYVYALSSQLLPRNVLADEKADPQKRRQYEPAIESRVVSAVKRAARKLNGQAAQQNRRSVCPHDLRHLKRNPIINAAVPCRNLAHYVGACERDKQHQYACKR